ncbi:Predicted transcriptional regulator [Microbulbifer donghaiensis]|uniref:Predicted transcriptional regulator n=1 Tax=Microbulbifer donghaiensis TaxID=494016 RepID=A0A1M4XNW3_9GAMM|nr:ribbon-helix-helix protein, CopG family [Microbulbifer donghaiensis]SHE95128.1 Predicted transcriptional regulator [Microbulbifer donghaiensis]
MLGVRLDEQLEQRLTALAKRMQRSKSYIAKEALKLYIEREETKEREKQIALARWESYQRSGEAISNDAVMELLDTWGTEQEKPCPEK